MNGLKVCSRRCARCLFSENPLVSPARRKDVIAQCLYNNEYFECHEGNLRDESICCRGWYESYGRHTQLIRIAERLHVVEMVDPSTGKRGEE